MKSDRLSHQQLPKSARERDLRATFCSCGLLRMK